MTIAKYALTSFLLVYLLPIALAAVATAGQNDTLFITDQRPLVGVEQM